MWPGNTHRSRIGGQVGCGFMWNSKSYRRAYKQNELGGVILHINLSGSYITTTYKHISPSVFTDRIISYTLWHLIFDPRRNALFRRSRSRYWRYGAASFLPGQQNRHDCDTGFQTNIFAVNIKHDVHAYNWRQGSSNILLFTTGWCWCLVRAFRWRHSTYLHSHTVPETRAWNR